MADPNAPTLSTPLDAAGIEGNVLVFVFTVPSDSDNDILVFQLEIDTNNPINTGSANYLQHESRLATDLQTNGKWEVKNAGGTYIALPTGGVDSTYYGRDAKVTIRLQDTSDYPNIDTTWYWRIGAGDGMSTSPVYNQAVYAQVIYGS